MILPDGCACRPGNLKTPQLTRHNDRQKSSTPVRLSLYRGNSCPLWSITLLVLIFSCSHSRSSLYSAPTQRCWARTSVHPTRPLHLITPPHLNLLMPAARLKTRLERPHHHPPFSLRVPMMNTKCNLSPTRSDISGLAAPSGDTAVCLVPWLTWRAFVQP